MLPSEALYFAFDLPACRATLGVWSDSNLARKRLLRCYREYQIDAPEHVSVQLRVVRSEDGFRLVTPWGETNIGEDFEDPHLSQPDNRVENRNRFNAIVEQAFLRAWCYCDSSIEPFHAACVCKGDACLALAGMPFSGKTTLALALCGLGWRVVTDDILIVRMPEGEAWPLRRGVSFRPGTGLDLERFAAPCSKGPVHNGSFSAAIAPQYLASVGQSYRLTDVAILDGFASQTRLSPLRATDGLFHFARYAFMPVGKGKAVARLRRYTSSLGNLNWWTCRPGSPREAASLLNTRIEPTPGRKSSSASLVFNLENP